MVDIPYPALKSSPLRDSEWQCVCCLTMQCAAACMSMVLVQVLRLLIKLYESVEKPDWVSISQCLLLLDDAPEVAKVLERLLKGSEVSPLLLAETKMFGPAVHSLQ